MLSDAPISFDGSLQYKKTDFEIFRDNPDDPLRFLLSFCASASGYPERNDSKIERSAFENPKRRKKIQSSKIQREN